MLPLGPPVPSTPDPLVTRAPRLSLLPQTDLDPASKSLLLSHTYARAHSEHIPTQLYVCRDAHRHTGSYTPDPHGHTGGRQTQTQGYMPAGTLFAPPADFTAGTQVC